MILHTCMGLEQHVVARSMIASVTPAVPLVASSSDCAPQRCTWERTKADSVVSCGSQLWIGQDDSHVHAKSCMHSLTAGQSLQKSPYLCYNDCPDTDRMDGSACAGRGWHAFTIHNVQHQWDC